MTPADLPGVMALAAVVHPAYPEDRAVFAERLDLWPPGCRVLDGRDEGAGARRGEGLAGYAVSHPWHAGAVPALNSLLGALPAATRTWYLHDLALRPGARGTGAAGRLVAELAHLAAAQGFAEMALVAVNGSSGFWRHHGFRCAHDASLDRRLASYDNEARYMRRRLGA